MNEIYRKFLRGLLKLHRPVLPPVSLPCAYGVALILNCQGVIKSR